MPQPFPGAAPTAVPGRPNNQLLARLPEEEFLRLQPRLHTVPLAPRMVLHQQDDAVRHVYFPNGGVVSLATVLKDGRTAEAATVGDDGLVGIGAFFIATPRSPCDTIVQIPGGTAERLALADFRHELAARSALHREVARYAEILHGQMIRLAACNVVHDVQERCARWLLMADDYMHHQHFHLSHEFLAVMLGVRRPTVSVVAHTLQAAGLIRYVHGDVTVLDREGLATASCECYAAIRALSDQASSVI